MACSEFSQFLQFKTEKSVPGVITHSSARPVGREGEFKVQSALTNEIWNYMLHNTLCKEVLWNACMNIVYMSIAWIPVTYTLAVVQGMKYMCTPSLLLVVELCILTLFWSGILTSAFCPKRHLTVAVWPLSAAQCIAVHWWREKN